MSIDNITVQEVTRNTAAGRFSYVMFQGRVVRRKAQRGRPHYDVVAGITLNENEKVVEREIALESQLGRALTEAVTAPAPKVKKSEPKAEATPKGKK